MSATNESLTLSVPQPPSSPPDAKDNFSPQNFNDKKPGRRKINIEYIDDKSRRHITFSKRKAGIMKKAYELSTLTGTQVLLLVASETGHVYTFATPKLQPLITKPEGKNLIQTCLNAPDPAQSTNQTSSHRMPQLSYQEPPHLQYVQQDSAEDDSYPEEKPKEMKNSYVPSEMNYANYQSPTSGNGMYNMPMGPHGNTYPSHVAGGHPHFQSNQYPSPYQQNSPYPLNGNQYPPMWSGVPKASSQSHSSGPSASVGVPSNHPKHGI